MEPDLSFPFHSSAYRPEDFSHPYGAKNVGQLVAGIVLGGFSPSLVSASLFILLFSAGDSWGALARVSPLWAFCLPPLLFSLGMLAYSLVKKFRVGWFAKGWLAGTGLGLLVLGMGSV